MERAPYGRALLRFRISALAGVEAGVRRGVDPVTEEAVDPGRARALRAPEVEGVGLGARRLHEVEGNLGEARLAHGHFQVTGLRLKEAVRAVEEQPHVDAPDLLAKL